jgi:hypothetical protein
VKTGYQCCGGPVYHKVRWEYACGCFVEQEACIHHLGLGWGHGGPLVCTVKHIDDIERNRVAASSDPYLTRYLWTQFFPDYTKLAHPVTQARPGVWNVMAERAKVAT